MTKQSNYFKLPIFLPALLVISTFSPFYALKAQDGATEISKFHIELLGMTQPLRELIHTWKEEPQPMTKISGATGMDDNELMFDHATLSPFPPAARQSGDLLFKKEDGQKQSSELTPLSVFEGMDYSTANYLSRPDATGDMGENCFIQTTNTNRFRLFDRQGIPLTPSLNTNILWSQVGMKALYDPVISYDESAGRWFLLEIGEGGIMMFALSVTSDPLGSWNIYFMPNKLTDYPKVGIWPGAYVVTTIEGTDWPVYLINREQMLAGAAYVDIQRIRIPHIPGNETVSLTPFDWNGYVLPPTDEVFVARLKDAAPSSSENDQIEVWGLIPGWGPTDQTITSLTSINTSPYDLHACANPAAYTNCLPQPDPPALDNYYGMIYTKVYCRNFGTYESAMLSFDANPGDNKSGIRWAELRRQAGGPWAIFQEGMVATQDGEFRFMSNIAINERGDIGLGYVVTGTNTYPSLRVTGRKAEDPPGEMPVSEYEIATGIGSLDHNHYGDYFSMTTDPVDGAFWYTGEYVLANNKFATKIAGFRVRKDSLDVGPAELVTPQNDVFLTDNETVTIRIKNYGLTPVQDFKMGFVLNNQAPVTEPAAITQLLPDSVYTHTFTTKANLGTPGEYQLKMFVISAGDQNPTNDTLRVFRHKLPRHDAAITQISTLDNGICTPEHPVRIIIQNAGHDTLYSLQLMITLNGQAPLVQNWSGMLAQGEKDTVEVLVTGFVDGDNSLVVKAFLPNGMEDEKPGNDIYERALKLEFAQGRVFFTLKTDSFPEQTSWEVTTLDHQVLYSGGPYPTQPQQEINEEWCLQPGACYHFELFDSAGNGMESSGDFTISDNTGAVLCDLGNSNFGSNGWFDFCLKELCTFELNTVVTDVSPPPYNSGAILVEVAGGYLPLQFSKNGGQTYQSSPLFTGLLPGNYKIVVKDFTACTKTLPVKVNIVSGTDQPQQPKQITVTPNPSADGMFQVMATGLSDDADHIPVEILNVDGKQVHTQSIPISGQTGNGIITLKKQPAGVYFARFQHNNGYQTIMLVKSQ